MTLSTEAQSPPLQADRDGVIRVSETRVTLNSVVHAFDEGHTAEEIVSQFPALKLADVYAVISYYLNNRVAVREYLQPQEAAADEVWREIERSSDYQMLRERLLAATGKSSES